MESYYPTLAAHLFTVATGGPWPLPRRCGAANPRDADDWHLLVPSTGQELCHVVTRRSDDPAQARANAALMSQARIMFTLLHEIASRGYATPSEQLIDLARVALRDMTAQLAPLLGLEPQSTKPPQARATRRREQAARRC